jgi:transposase
LRSFKKSGEQCIGRSKGGLTTKLHFISADAKTAVDFTLSSGQAHDAPQGRILMDTLGKQRHVVPLIMDRGYEDDYTRYIAQTLNFYPVVPPKSNRKNPWYYDKELYKRRNEIERFFRLIKGFRRIFTRFEKLDVMLVGFIQLALVYLVIR